MGGLAPKLAGILSRTDGPGCRRPWMVRIMLVIFWVGPLDMGNWPLVCGPAPTPDPLGAGANRKQALSALRIG
jgi:hypothetical protein